MVEHLREDAFDILQTYDGGYIVAASTCQLMEM